MSRLRREIASLTVHETPRARVLNAIGACDRHLGRAQDVIGRHLVTAEMREDSPRTHTAASEAYDLVERARHVLAKASLFRRTP